MDNTVGTATSFGSDKGKRERTPAPAIGLLDVFSVNGDRKKFIGPSLLIDVSQGGLAIQLDDPVLPGEKLLLKNRMVSYVVKVCHCEQWQSGYKIGVQFLDPNKGD
jgi:PilZ domain